MAAETSNTSSKLFVRNLPAELNDEDKKDLMKCFGAKNVVCFGKKGKMVSEENILV